MEIGTKLRANGDLSQDARMRTETRAQPKPYALLDLSPLPMAITEGAKHVLLYANAAFCHLLDKGTETLIGNTFAKLLPEESDCLLLLDRVYHSGKGKPHTQQEPSHRHPLLWSYEVWPIVAEPGSEGSPGRIIVQVTATADFQRRAAAINEALLLAAVRQHELVEQADTLNAQLRAEIQERKRAEVEIEHLAFYDPLTNLPNRRLLLDRLQHALVTCTRTRRHGALFFIDMDAFKTVNDTRGHDFGDLLLQQVAHRLTASVRKSDTVARLGGDEFVVMLQELSTDVTAAEAAAKRIGTKILASLNERYQIAGVEQHSTASIGTALFDQDSESIEDLLKRADLALYQAKAEGRRGMRLFDPEMQALVTARAVLDTDLREALREHQFILYYQRQVNHDGELIGAEALIRWQHPERGLLYPAEFIPFAEENGLIKYVGRWVLEAACIQLKAWSANTKTAALTLSINVSAEEFRDSEFVQRTLGVIDRMSVDPGKLILEFTERAMLGPGAETLSKMAALKSRGIRFSLDDFGIGYSSLTYLKSLPLDQLKIDRSFVQDVLTNASDAIIAPTIIALGQSLGMTVVAEGVETEEQHGFLALHGCRTYQGYLFGRPVPIEELC